jgi:hypothetical protein
MAAHLCSYNKCRSRLPGAHEVFIRVWPEGVSKLSIPPGHVATRFILCNDCAAAVEIETLVTDKMWSQVLYEFKSRGAAPPCRKTAEIVFKRPASSEGRELM